MIFLYTLVLLFLGAVKLLIDRRVARLEKKYAQTAKQAEHLLRESQYKGGNNRFDPAQLAKRQYLLGLQVQKRDRLETKYVAAQHLDEKFGVLVTRIRDWKGKKLPYTLGVVDVSLLMCLIDRLGVGDSVSVNRLVQMLSSLMNQ